ncbi:MAG: hypothetical protein P8J59_04405 [Phycisphaerales bacterium]|jgi:hypothetical protein|nr:hypothetical protein [Phycisphaerales bacterium]
MKRILEVRGTQAVAILGLLRQVATDEGVLPLHEIHLETLRAMAEHLFQTTYDPDSPPPPFSEGLDIVGDKELARDVLNMAGILPFVEEEHEQDRIDAVGRLAEALGFDHKFAKRLRQLSHESVSALAICLYRPFSLEVGAPLWLGGVKLAESMVHIDGDKKVLARYEGFRELDPNTFGGTLLAYYDDNDFPLPGTPGAFFSNSLTIHDMHHVLAGYPTSPLGETCVVAFDSGMMDLDMGKALIGYIAQFQIGVQFDKGLRSWKNQFNPDAVLRAFERGGDSRVNYLTLDFDFDPYLERPLADVRREFGIDPNGALISGPADKWCGQVGVVGQRSSPDLVERKKSLLERLLTGKNTKD